MHSIPQTQIYHAALAGGLSGLSFQVGETVLFTPVDEEQVYILDPQQITVTTLVPTGMAAFLTATVIEPRLAALAGRQEVA
jgi:hypothetical protein